MIKNTQYRNISWNYIYIYIYIYVYVCMCVSIKSQQIIRLYHKVRSIKYKNYSEINDLEKNNTI